jgi:hypothetical protein
VKIGPRPQLEGADTRSSTTSAFQEAQLPVQAKLAAAWTSFMFLYIYVDYHKSGGARLK